MNPVRIKRSTVAGKIPETSKLEVGEFAVNLTDRKVYLCGGTDLDKEIIQIYPQPNALVFVPFRFYAKTLDTPNTSDWAVNSSATMGNDSTNSAISVYAFDDTVEEGVGFTLTVPENATALKIDIKSRAAIDPSSLQTAVYRLYARTIPNGSAVSAWTSTDIEVNYNNAYYVYYQVERALSALSLTAGTLVQFELTRVGSETNDTLAGDTLLVETAIGFS